MRVQACLGGVALLLWMAGASGRAQETKPGVRFEVVSVKASSPDCELEMIGPSRDGFHLHCLSLQQMVQYAYGLRFFEENHVLGLPGWATKEPYDLDAPVQEADLQRYAGLSNGEKASLVRVVLAERFGLRVHEEQHQMPVFALVQGKPPLKLKAVAPITPERTQTPFLQWKSASRLQATNCTMAQLVWFLSPVQGRPLVDRTNLSGQYDFSLEFARETGKVEAGEEGGPASIFTAVQEQLGLRLVAEKAAQRVVVVDTVSRPTAN